MKPAIPHTHDMHTLPRIKSCLSHLPITTENGVNFIELSSKDMFVFFREDMAKPWKRKAEEMISFSNKVRKRDSQRTVDEEINDDMNIDSNSTSSAHLSKDKTKDSNGLLRGEKSAEDTDKAFSLMLKVYVELRHRVSGFENLSLDLNKLLSFLTHVIKKKDVKDSEHVEYALRLLVKDNNLVIPETIAEEDFESNPVDPLIKDVDKIYDVVSGISREEIYAYLQAHQNKSNRVNIVLEELLQTPDEDLSMEEEDRPCSSPPVMEHIDVLTLNPHCRNKGKGKSKIRSIEFYIDEFLNLYPDPSKTFYNESSMVR